MAKSKYFTIIDNMGFKITFGDVVVAVCADDVTDKSKDKLLYTYNDAVVCIYNRRTHELLNKFFIGPHADDYRVPVNPENLVDILIKVKAYTSQQFACKS